MDIINEFLKNNYEFIEFRDGILVKRYPKVTKAIECNDGYSISVQANECAYCTPRKNEAWPYERVELGFPLIEDELINEYAECKEDYTNTVYPYVPIEIVVKLIQKHGGIKNGKEEV